MKTLITLPGNFCLEQMKAFFLKCGLLFVLLFATGKVWSQATYFLTTAGSSAPQTPANWNTGGTGGGGTAATVFTGATDIFVISSGITASYPANVTATFAGTLQVDGLIVIGTNGIGTTTTLTINGTVLFNSTSNQVTFGTSGGSGNNGFVLGSSAILKTKNSTGVIGTNCSLTLNGNKTSATLPTTANYEFNGATQSTTGLPSPVNNLTFSGTGPYTQTAAVSVSGTLFLSSGTYNNGVNLTLASGATISRNTGVLANAPTFTITVNVIYTSTGATNSGNEIPVATTILSGLSVTGSGTISLTTDATAKGAISLSGGNLTINAAKTLTSTSAGSITVASTKILTISNTATLINQATATMSLTGASAITVSSGGTYVHNTTTGGISTPLASISQVLGSNFIYRGAGASPNTSFSGKTYAGNLTLETTGGSYTTTASGSTAVVVNGKLTVGAGVTFDFATFTGANTFNGDIDVLGTLTGLGSFTVQSGKTLNISGTYGGGATTTISSSTVTISSLTASVGTSVFSYTSGSLNYNYTNGTGTNRNIGTEWPSANSPTDVTVAVTGTGTNTISLTGPRTIAGNLILTSGILAIASNTLTLNSGVSGAGSFTSNANGTVNYNQSSNGQAVIASNYGNLTFSNFNKTLASSGIIGIAGTFTTGSATGHTVTGSTVNFNNATGGQTVPAFNYNSLTTSNTSGVQTLSGSIGVSGTFSPSAGALSSAGTSTVNFNNEIGRAHV